MAASPPAISMECNLEVPMHSKRPEALHHNEQTQQPVSATVTCKLCSQHLGLSVKLSGRSRAQRRAGLFAMTRREGHLH